MDSSERHRQEPLISIIIPVYKVEKYLDRCINSIVSQTYSNLEIILIDDGSPDSSPIICDNWRKKDARIQVIHKSNEGLSATRNLGIELASGDYISFVDSDDYCLPLMYEKLVSMQEEYDAEITICNFFNEESSYRVENKAELKKKIYTPNELIKIYFLNNHSPRELVTAWESCIKKICL